MSSAKIHTFSPDQIVSHYGIRCRAASPIGSGLIHQTWKITADRQNFILQKINTGVFRQPEDVDFNINLIAQYLADRHPEYRFMRPLPVKSGTTLLHLPEAGWFRLFPFVEGSFTYEVVPSETLARQAAFGFGTFTSKLSGFDATQLKITIPAFHDLSARYRAFEQAVFEGNPARIKKSEPLIKRLVAQADLVAAYEAARVNPAFKTRVTHHDTKISNILFDENGKSLCVIDLDTVMPGYFFSDAGDMMRTFLSAANEEEQDFSKISARRSFYHAIKDGYTEGMQGGLSQEELGSFRFAGSFMTFMQAVRFLTDYLNNDPYYGAEYPDHNLIRAGNQAALLEKIQALPD